MLNFNFPLDEKYREPSSLFGWRWLKVGNMIVPIKQFHRGQDHPTPIGTPGKAAYKGFVSHVWTSLRSGLCLEIEHLTCNANGIKVKTIYRHLLKIHARMLQWVEDEVIYETGNSGLWVSGKGHLHWEVKAGNRFVDPRICYD